MHSLSPLSKKLSFAGSYEDGSAVIGQAVLIKKSTMNIGRIIYGSIAGGFVFMSAIYSEESKPPPRPNILLLLADDLGWQDVGYQEGSEIKTPALNALAASGVRLNHFYVQPVCSPTRACLMTGRYCSRYGFQSVVMPTVQYGLPLNERLLPQALKEVGYETAITGKWHLGLFERAYLPTYRGFDHQYGQYCGWIDYYTHERAHGLDWHRDDHPLREEGYTTQLIAREAVRLINGHDTSKPLFLYVPFNAPHGPLQAPREYIDRYANIKDQSRRKFAAMVTCMDDAIADILAALDKRGMRDNTIVIFSSDNGGPIGSGASNGSLRRGKASLYEGGLRVPAFITWPGRLKAGTVVNEPLHIVDWYTTLLKLAGAKLDQPLPLDGLDIWPTIAEGKPSPHKEILHHYEDTRAAIRCGDWKLIRTSQRRRVANQPADKAKVSLEFSNKKLIELFNIAVDPSEKTNLAAQYPEKVQELTNVLDRYGKQMVPSKALVVPVPQHFKTPKVWGEKDE